MANVVRAAGYVIYRKLNGIVEYLLLQASYEPFHWTPPKGHVDTGENEEQAAAREVREEAGYVANDLNMVKGFIKTIKYVANNHPKSVVYWLAELKDPNKNPCLSKEHKDYKWLPLEEACTISNFETTKELLKDCDKYLKEQ